ncbi:MAG: 2-methylcitrate dehydratase PrpD, partial [Glaciecola sp.]
MSSLTLVQQLAAFAETTYTNGLPVEVATSTRQRVLDVIGLCLAS